MDDFRAEALLSDPRRQIQTLTVLAAQSLQIGDPAASFRYADRLCRLSKASARAFLLRSEASRRAGYLNEAHADLESALALDPADLAVLRYALQHGDASQKRAAGLLDADDTPLLSKWDEKGLGGDASRSAAGLDGGRGASRVLSVIVPVFEDFEATRACFEALFDQEAGFPVEIVAVDDASPNANLRDWLDAQAHFARLKLIRNAANVGFAASVNRALSTCISGDVVLLNADALLPPNGLSRLAEIALVAPGVGTVTPLSNNGEYTSFPEPNVANPLPTPREIARINALAWSANGANVVDLPNGIGFCLYITRACLDAVGPLPEIYARGYFEDVEFCLRARERGFRNVCATGVYVGHAGSRSFGAEKRRLVVRNLATLTRRFPGYRIESASFLEADPLRTARRAIEALAPNRGETVLLVCAGGASLWFARKRASELAAEGRLAPLLCEWEQGGRIILRGVEGHWPQSLDYRLDDGAGLGALADYLAARRIDRIELFDPFSLPFCLLMAFFRLRAPVDLVGGDLEWAVALPLPQSGACPEPDGAAPCRACATNAFSAQGAEPRSADRLGILRRARSVRPLDRMGELFARRIFDESFVISCAEPEVAIAPLLRPQGARALAVIMPLPDPLADRLIVALGRALLSMDSPARIVVLGACVNDFAVMAPANIFVAGPVETGDYERLLRQYEILALMTPYRTRLFGFIEQLSRRFAMPKAYFDYSGDEWIAATDDLALDPRLCDSKSAVQVANWLQTATSRALAP